MGAGVESARLKVSRAGNHLESIREEITRYRASQPCEVVTGPDGSQYLNVVTPPPLEISILSGEVAYQLRSALDHLAFTLVKMNACSGALPARWFERCEFPLWQKIPGSQQPPLSKNNFSNILPGIADEPFAFIESLQPYNAGRDASIMGILANLSNVDKHRYLNLSVGKGLVRQEVSAMNGMTVFYDGNVEHGAQMHTARQILDAAGPVQMKTSISSDVFFKESGLSPRAPVMYVLGECIGIVRDKIIPKFEEFFKLEAS